MAERPPPHPWLVAATALLLPGCSLERASQIAEALRSHIEALPIALPIDLSQPNAATDLATDLPRLPLNDYVAIADFVIGITGLPVPAPS
mgnify:CR=1 FL=1